MEGYVQSSQDFVFLPGALGAASVLSRWAPQIVVVTNQQGIGKGLMTAAQLDQIHRRMRDDIADAGGRIDSVESCPHLASDDCDCRKPRTGMAERYLAAHPEIDSSLSIMVGDADSDIAMARRLALVTGGCVSIRIGGHDDPLADGTYPTLAAFAAAVEPLLEDPDGAAGYSAE
jgi:D-glycero-D-manno-heptose 1,7-bisphosphate phosphatase